MLLDLCQAAELAAMALMLALAGSAQRAQSAAGADSFS
jgi:hypothetical protein